MSPPCKIRWGEMFKFFFNIRFGSLKQFSSTRHPIKFVASKKVRFMEIFSLGSNHVNFLLRRNCVCSRVPMKRSILEKPLLSFPVFFFTRRVDDNPA